MFEEILAKLARALDKNNITYMIIGGQAVLLYGEPRLTRDIDVTLGDDIDILPKIIEVTKYLNLKPLPLDITEFVRQTMVLPTRDESSGIRVDFIFSFTPYERQAIEKAKEVLLKKTPVRFAAPEDVIIHKVFAGRARDLDDVKSILVKNPSVNLAYIEKWLTEFDKGSPEAGLLRKFKDILDTISKNE